MQDVGFSFARFEADYEFEARVGFCFEDFVGPEFREVRDTMDACHDDFVRSRGILAGAEDGSRGILDGKVDSFVQA